MRDDGRKGGEKKVSRTGKKGKIQMKKDRPAKKKGRKKKKEVRPETRQLPKMRVAPGGTVLKKRSNSVFASFDNLITRGA